MSTAASWIMPTTRLLWRLSHPHLTPAAAMAVRAPAALPVILGLFLAVAMAPVVRAVGPSVEYAVLHSMKNLLSQSQTYFFSSQTLISYSKSRAPHRKCDIASMTMTRSPALEYRGESWNKSTSASRIANSELDCGFSYPHSSAPTSRKVNSSEVRNS